MNIPSGRKCARWLAGLAIVGCSLLAGNDSARATSTECTKNTGNSGTNPCANSGWKVTHKVYTVNDTNPNEAGRKDFVVSGTGSTAYGNLACADGNGNLVAPIVAGLLPSGNQTCCYATSSNCNIGRSWCGASPNCANAPQ